VKQLPAKFQWICKAKFVSHLIRNGLSLTTAHAGLPTDRFRPRLTSCANKKHVLNSTLSVFLTYTIQTVISENRDSTGQPWASPGYGAFNRERTSTAELHWKGPGRKRKCNSFSPLKFPTSPATHLTLWLRVPRAVLTVPPPLNTLPSV
jgi:hypothetical protein